MINPIMFDPNQVYFSNILLLQRLQYERDYKQSNSNDYLSSYKLSSHLICIIHKSKINKAIAHMLARVVSYKSNIRNSSNIFEEIDARIRRGGYSCVMKSQMCLKFFEENNKRYLRSFIKSFHCGKFFYQKAFPLKVVFVPGISKNLEVLTSSLRRDRRSKCCLFFITRSPYPKNPEDISDLCFHTAQGISRIFLPDKGFKLGMSERIGGELLHDEEKVQLVMIMSTTTSPTRSCFFEQARRYRQALQGLVLRASVQGPSRLTSSMVALVATEALSSCGLTPRNSHVLY
ncbi:LOW QUALITY PROTEIN: hypothetical protein YC2023_075799 [Brassica napus]